MAGIRAARTRSSRSDSVAEQADLESPQTDTATAPVVDTPVDTPTAPPADTGSATNQPAEKSKGGRPKKSEDTVTPLTLDDVISEEVSEDDMSAILPPQTRTQERSTEQKAVDQLVQDLYDQWIARGKPDVLKDSPWRSFYVLPEQVKRLQYMLSKGALVAKNEKGTKGVQARFGKPVKDREHNGRKGLTLVTVSVRERRTRTVKPKDAEGKSVSKEDSSDPSGN